MGYVIEKGFSRGDSFGSSQYGGLRSSLKKARKKVTSGVKTAARTIDLTSKRSLLNRALPKPIAAQVQKYAKQAVATSTVAVTGGAVLIAKPSLFKSAAAGFQTGAMIGGAIAGGKLASMVPWKPSLPVISTTASAPIPEVGQPLVSADAPSTMTADAATTSAPAVSTAGTNLVSDRPAQGGAAKLVGPAAGAAAGFLVFGPIGAAVGAGLGLFAARKK